MKVSELVEKLSKLNQGLEVWTCAPGGLLHPVEASEISLLHVDEDGEEVHDTIQAFALETAGYGFQEVALCYLL